MSGDESAATHTFEHRGVLGTVIDVLVGTNDSDLACKVDEVVLAEILRFQAVFSAFDPGSELCRWRRGLLDAPSGEFSELMGRVLDWQERSQGRFNPLAGVLSELWGQAAATGAKPSTEALVAMSASIAEPRFAMVAGVPVVTADCSAMNLNAMAKGFIVDQAVATGAGLEPSWICVNAGGDLAHRGIAGMQVGIENPHRPYDNEPPLAVITVSNAAVATSGNSRRGFTIGGTWFGHVIDPRTGVPVDEIASLTVVAQDAMTADVLATVAGVMTPPQAVDYLEETHGVIAGLVIDRDRGQWPTQGWPALVLGL